MENKFLLETSDMKEYLKSFDIIDFDKEPIKKIAEGLSKGINNEIELAKKVYEYVRDNIAHSFDINGNMVTCKASEVLEHKQGICYAKAHLLAAILRYLGIPTGFCYQKLILDDEETPWVVLHGLNAIFLKSIGKWIRVDSRGNKEGVNAEFSLEEEKLAFPIREELGEEDELVIYPNPNKNVINALMTSSNIIELTTNLPSEL